MAYQVKRSIVTIVTIVVGLIVYGWYVFSNIGDPLTIYEFGMYILIAIPVLVILQIIGKIIFDLFNRTQEKKEEPQKMDEFDKLIEYKAVRNFTYTIMIGFFSSMLLMWILGTLLVPFIVLFLSLFASGIVLQISYIVYYTKGV